MNETREELVRYAALLEALRSLTGPAAAAGWLHQLLEDSLDMERTRLLVGYACGEFRPASRYVLRAWLNIPHPIHDGAATPRSGALWAEFFESASDEDLRLWGQHRGVDGVKLREVIRWVRAEREEDESLSGNPLSLPGDVLDVFALGVLRRLG